MNAPRWARTTLWLAAVYNVLWGGSIVLFPGWLFAALDVPPPTYLSIWQCVGMIVGVGLNVGESLCVRKAEKKKRKVGKWV